MKKKAARTTICIRPIPQTIVSCRDQEGHNNALAVSFTANVSLDPVMIMVGIVPTRYSHHIIKESGCFAVNLPDQTFLEEYQYLGSHTGWDGDKFKKLQLRWEDADYINAPLLTDCPVSIECTVVESTHPGTHELLIGKVEAVHVEERYLDGTGNIRWDKMKLLNLVNTKSIRT